MERGHTFSSGMTPMPPEYEPPKRLAPWVPLKSPLPAPSSSSTSSTSSKPRTFSAKSSAVISWGRAVLKLVSPTRRFKHSSSSAWPSVSPSSRRSLSKSSKKS